MIFFIILVTEDRILYPIARLEDVAPRIAESNLEAPVAATISLGVADFAPGCPSVKALLQRVGAALYATTNAGAIAWKYGQDKGNNNNTAWKIAHAAILFLVQTKNSLIRHQL